jgi:hypothetical protein
MKISIKDVEGEGWWAREKKVGKHKRKLNSQEYISPRIVLSSDYNHLIGKSFEVYRAKGKIVEEGWRKREKEGEMLILFFPEDEEGDKAEDEDFEDPDWEDD